MQNPSLENTSKETYVLSLDADRKNVLASIIKGFILLNKMKPGRLRREALNFLVELGEYTEAEVREFMLATTDEQ